MRIADAPALAAFSVLRRNVHVPRLTSAMRPVVKPAKSPGAQPVTTPDGCSSSAVTVPLPE